jgi:antitoxin ParD1/3/4
MVRAGLGEFREEGIEFGLLCEEGGQAVLLVASAAIGHVYLRRGAGHSLRVAGHSRCAARRPSKIQCSDIAMFRDAGSHHDHSHNRLKRPACGISFLPFFAKKEYYPRMTTMNVSLPDSLKSFVDEQVSACGYSTSSEYVRQLIRKDQDRQRLRGLLLEGAASRPTAPADDAYFDTLRQRARQSKQA